MVEDDSTIVRYRVRETEAAFASAPRSRTGARFALGLRRGDGSTHVLVGDPALRPANSTSAGPVRDSATTGSTALTFPTQGQAFRVELARRSRVARREPGRRLLSASGRLARSRDRYSFVWSMDAGSALDDKVDSPQELFTLGGFLELSGLPPDALVGTQYGIARAIVYRRISRGGTGFFEYPRLPRRLGRGRQRLADARRRRSRAISLGGSLFLGAESPFGPIYLAAGLARMASRRFYLFLGKTF